MGGISSLLTSAEVVRIPSAEVDFDYQIGHDDISEDDWSLKRCTTTDTDNKGDSDCFENSDGYWTQL